jgi:hypothetical protein
VVCGRAGFPPADGEAWPSRRGGDSAEAHRHEKDRELGQGGDGLDDQIRNGGAIAENSPSWSALTGPMKRNGPMAAKSAAVHGRRAIKAKDTMSRRA